MSCARLNGCICQKFIVKINDFPDANIDISYEEKVSRCQMASLCRILELYGWTKSIHYSLSLKLSNRELLMTPFGLLPCEISASSLFKMNSNGDIIGHLDINIQSNKSDLLIHQEIHKYLHEAVCVIKLENSIIEAICSLGETIKSDFDAFFMFGKVSFCNSVKQSYMEENSDIIKAFETSNVLFCRDKILLCRGKTIEEAFFFVFNTMHACLTILNKSRLINITKGCTINASHAETPVSVVNDTQKFIDYVGHLEFDAHLRLLDRMGNGVGLAHGPELLHPVRVTASYLGLNDAVSEKEEIHLARMNSDSGVATLRCDTDNGSVGSFNIYDDSCNVSESVPYSESSKELLMCISHGTDENIDEEGRSKTPDITTNTKLGSPTQKRLKSLTRDDNLIRRSKSLTSGVEKAIFRRHNERIITEKEKK